MRASLGDESTPVYQQAAAESISVTTLHKGDEFEIGKIIRQRKATWVTVTLDSGFTGYITGDTHIFAIQQVEAIGNDLDLRESPSEESPVLKVIPKKTLFTVRGVEKVEDISWYRVVDSSGVKGYIRSGLKLRVRPQVTVASGRKMMITGGIFAVAGIVLYFAFPTGAEAGSGNISIITLAVILLGLFQVIQGFMQYRQAKKEAESKGK